MLSQSNDSVITFVFVIAEQSCGKLGKLVVSIPKLIIDDSEDMALPLCRVCGRGFAEAWGCSQVSKEMVVEPVLAQ